MPVGILMRQQRTKPTWSMRLWLVAVAAVMACTEVRISCEPGEERRGNYCTLASDAAEPLDNEAPTDAFALDDREPLIDLPPMVDNPQPASCPSSCGANVDCAPCATPGDPGNYCCVSGLCLYMTGACASDAGPRSDIASLCPAPRTMCGVSCVETSSDIANCGGCGRVCPTGAVCTAGSCVCSGALALCGSVCVNTLADRANCGGCGRVCSGGQVCASGVCVSTCAAPRRMCGATCSDTTSDNNNCGDCGRVCSVGQNCSAGACQSPPVDCNAQRTCGGCTPLAGCGWCGATAQCMPIGPGCSRPSSCSAGWACNPEECNPRVGLTCASDLECAPSGTPIASRCLANPGVGPGSTCAAVCTGDSSCSSRCCSDPLPSGVRVCLNAAFCSDRSSCSSTFGGACTDDRQCCFGTDADRPNASFCSTGASSGCGRLCSLSRHCTTGCCAFNVARGVWGCVTVPDAGGSCAPY